MFTGDIKRKRFYPDDPWEKYNNMSYDRYKASLKKNEVLIKEHGNRVYKFDRWRAHQDMYGDFNHLPYVLYAPPGFIKTTKDNGGVYKPDDENVIPEPDWMAPHFQRHAIRRPDFIDATKNFFIKTPYYPDRWITSIRKKELYGGYLPSWSRLLVRKGPKPTN